MTDNTQVFVTRLSDKRKRQYLDVARAYFGNPRLTELQIFGRMLRFAYAEMSRKLKETRNHPPDDRPTT